ncbi:MAG: hypothetical protein QXN23_01110 [Candidatus Caldarchaeum sp.]|nr:hypothetical protein [Candidatus Caldarchaeales archaeon]
MLGHLGKRAENIVCRVCGAVAEKPDSHHYVTGFGYVCRRCGLQPVVCDGCGAKVRRMTVTVLRGRTLCLNCYRVEREKGEKRIFKEHSANSVEEAFAAALENSPEGYVFVGIRLKPSSKQVWVAEYEREDIFLSRCS